VTGPSRGFLRRGCVFREGFEECVEAVFCDGVEEDGEGFAMYVCPDDLDDVRVSEALEVRNFLYSVLTR